MDRGAWWATVQGVGKSQTTEATQHAQSCKVETTPVCAIFLRRYFFFFFVESTEVHVSYFLS